MPSVEIDLDWVQIFDEYLELLSVMSINKIFLSIKNFLYQTSFIMSYCNEGKFYSCMTNYSSTR